MGWHSCGLKADVEAARFPMNVLKIIDAIRRYRHDENLGDFGVRLIDALGRAMSPLTEERVRRVEPCVRPVDLRQLRALPADSFGRAYARYFDDHEIRQLDISRELNSIVQRNRAAVRYLSLHDIIHTLLGFDTSLAGELGVIAFAAAQGYSRDLYTNLFINAHLYPLAEPHHALEMNLRLRQGWSAGRRSLFLLDKPLEEEFHKSIDEVRRTYYLRLP